ncbi:MAG: pyridoxal phosphate-dependent aminotransferase family protein [Chloroflexota bacterium]
MKNSACAPQRRQSPFGARMLINGREVDYFSGTGYLGLQNHPAVVQAAMDALQRYGFSTATPRGSYGEHPLYDALEKEACAFFDAEKVLPFASGYLGMAVLTQVSSSQFEHIFIDSAAHYSLWDAAQATNKPITPFHHCQPASLEACLRRDLLTHERPLVMSDGVFPVSGEIAPLADYLAMIKPYGGLIYVDDAHGAGVLGENGRGTLEYYHLQDECIHSCATLSKALGGYGGLIWGDANWVENIDRNSGICAGASPLPLPVVAASACALALARTTPALRQQLYENVALARRGLRGLGWTLEDTPVPILCLEARPGFHLERIEAALFEKGIAVTVVRSYPSTPPGGALRIAIFATHTKEQIERLVETLRSVMKSLSH